MRPFVLALIGCTMSGGEPVECDALSNSIARDRCLWKAAVEAPSPEEADALATRIRDDTIRDQTWLELVRDVAPSRLDRCEHITQPHVAAGCRFASEKKRADP